MRLLYKAGTVLNMNTLNILCFSFIQLLKLWKYNVARIKIKKLSTKQKKRAKNDLKREH